MFTSIPTAREAHRLNELPVTARSYARDTITLGWEERVKGRARRTSDSGFEFATALPRGTVLRDGDCFVFDTPPLAVGVVELAEPVLVIRPASPMEWALFAYHIGNSHQPLMLAEDALVCPDYLGMSQVLSYYGIPFSREDRPFTPVSQVSDHRHQVPR